MKTTLPCLLLSLTKTLPAGALQGVLPVSIKDLKIPHHHDNINKYCFVSIKSHFLKTCALNEIHSFHRFHIMIDNRASKRRLSDADKNERIAMRQMVLNMSMCKLQKRHGRKEPSLRRTVIINNTVQQIEREMDNEMLAAEYEMKNQQYKEMHMHVDDYFSPTSYTIEQTAQSVDAQVTTFTFDETSKFDKKENKFGAIGDHRKINPPTDSLSNKPAGFVSGFMWDSLTLPTLTTHNANPILEAVEVGSNFTDVDISLYDFDNSFQSFQAKEWQPYPRSCASEYDRCQPDSFFQELDQIMQVLVGM